MISLISVSKAQRKLRKYLKTRRLQQGLTQEGLALRAGVSLAALRQFEQKGLISLESFLKLLIVLDQLEAFVTALEPSEESFLSIDEVLKTDQKNQKKERKRGWRT